LNRKIKSLLALILAFVMTASCCFSVFADDEGTRTLSKAEAQRQKNAIANFVMQVSSTYYYGVEDEDLLYRALCSTIDNGSYDFDKAVEAIMKGLKDGYSEYYTPERYQSLYSSIQGEYYGIGVSIMLSSEHVVITGVFPGSPAESAGLKAYDKIVSVDGQSIANLSTSDVANLIKREKGAPVKIGIIRGNTEMEVDCICDEVSQNPVSYEIMEDGKIGYIYISTFSANLDDYITPILNEFDEKGIKNVILDLRNNGGGELNAALSLANHFIPSGVITKLKYKDETLNEDLTVTNSMTEPKYNLVLLVNENSASASELFTAAVKDRKAGTIIGTNTFGKGSMQSVFRLSTGSGVKYTIAEFYSPNDNRIHTIGVTPDYTVENEVYTVDEDNFAELDLDKAGDTSESENILAIEERLNSLGCFSGNPDNVFDDETRNALRYFQTVKGLEITGEPDLYTLIALNDYIYDFELENDNQLEAAKNYILTGKID
jgi:carboxyl-terminal processing protease